MILLDMTIDCILLITDDIMMIMIITMETGALITVKYFRFFPAVVTFVVVLYLQYH